MSKDLEVRHCRVLLAVQEHGGVSAAAQALGMAQSTVSETLLSLERLLGAPVTVRRPGREATLTPQAEALLPHAQSLLLASEAAMAAITKRSHAPIRLGTVESISSFLLPAPLRAFRSLWPDVDVRITIGVCEELRKRVGRAELDVALTIEGAARANSDSALSPATLRLLVAPAHPLAKSVVTQRDLTTSTFLLADPEGAFTGLLRTWVGSAAAKFESAGSIDGVKRGVLQSDAIGVLPDYAVAEELAAGALIALQVDTPLPPISLQLTTLHAPAPSSPLDSLIAQIREAARA
ncbi:LysR family transcriptional regulator [Roseiterribacter gracilis]|uniref:LysR family transcriptional regulator n=1 Tax=Roseiterribacter gracilis TaxID=2812848 RepID=A0A8S8XB60_9PROT|nr:LysR family transcriptional regulator [Rhodospirillales bacterium TMPK1]